MNEKKFFKNCLFLVLHCDYFLDGCSFKVDSITAHFSDFRQVKIMGHFADFDQVKIEDHLADFGQFKYSIG